MKLVNLTNQTIRVYDETGRYVLIEVPTDPPAAKAEVSTDTVAEHLEDDTGHVVTIVRHQYNLSEVLPAEIPDTLFVVGWAVLQSLADSGEHRDDLIAPDTSRESAVRNSNGRIVGVRKFRTL